MRQPCGALSHLGSAELSAELRGQPTDQPAEVFWFGVVTSPTILDQVQLESTRVLSGDTIA